MLQGLAEKVRKLTSFEREPDSVNSELEARDFRLSEFRRAFPKA